MQIGVVYPQTELAVDATTVRAYAGEVERMGYRHILVYDHVLGADPLVHSGWSGPYDIDTTFHEPFVLFGFLAALTSMELVTGIIISPQRQTALIAKQAAEVDLLSEGGLRLGLGVGWNRVEYESLGEDFATRGRRQEEQIGLLRSLWNERSVDFEGEFDRVRGAGLCPRPKRSVPIWLGGASEAAYRRTGRLADGWLPQVAPGPRLDEAVGLVGRAAEEAGRDPAGIGMEGRVSNTEKGVPEMIRHIEKWNDAGATHLGINTMGSGLRALDEHLEVLGQVSTALGLNEGDPS